MNRIIIYIVTVGLISVLSLPAVWAQATAQISGTARDQSGAVLPGVEVTAMQTETGIARNTVTNEAGLYVLSNLAIGPYRLERLPAQSEHQRELVAVSRFGEVVQAIGGHGLLPHATAPEARNLPIAASS